MPNRTQAPPIKQIHALQLPKPERYTLDNGIPVYVTNLGTQNVVRMELVFYAGRPFEKAKLAARSTASLLKEGSKHFSSNQIAEKMDFWGCSLGTPFNLDTSNITLHSLRKHFAKALPIIADLLTNPLFPEQELKAFIQRNKQRLKVDLTKNDVVAYRQITEFIFGSAHPYGYNSFADTYGQVTREVILDHFQSFYKSDNCAIFLSGKIEQKEINVLNEQLGGILEAGTMPFKAPSVDLNTPEKVKITNSDTVQTAIRIGRRLFNRNHPDYQGMYVLNTVLGGYFGSRLMANIREDKGYTYNIYSTLDPMALDGYFYIGSEVGNEFTEQTLTEIYKEIEILQNELVPEEELQMVKNYLLGNFLTMLDGPFNVNEVVKTIVTEQLNENFFEQLIQKVQAIHSTDLLELAQRYLNPSDLWEVTVGE